MTTKEYNSPMLSIVSIKRNDIITGSDPILNGTYSGGEILAPNRFDDYDAGY